MNTNNAFGKISDLPLVDQESIKKTTGNYTSGKQIKVGDTMLSAFLDDGNTLIPITLELSEINMIYVIMDLKKGDVPILRKL